MVIRLQGLDYAALTGARGPVPAGWVRETQMALEELEAYVVQPQG